MSAGPSELTGRLIAEQVSALYCDLIRQRLRAILHAEVETVIDEALKELPAEVRASVLHDHADPLGPPVVRVDVKTGRLP